jgi:hypothetical protein
LGREKQRCQALKDDRKKIKDLIQSKTLDIEKKEIEI